MRLAWIEIPASNIARAMTFYEDLLNIKLQRQILFERNVALFKKESFGINGCIIESDKQNIGGGIKPVFKVDVMCDAIQRVEMNGGKILHQPTLLRQISENGELMIGKNFIDNDTGYISEVFDCEGNCIFLYSHY
jgi:predicted enzyme related to lactoylglutathione lyase